MHKQWELPLDQGDRRELLASLNDQQRAEIRAALKELFEAALSLCEEPDDDQ